jgi:hypothetical protein
MADGEPRRDAQGRPVCQVAGCEEPAVPWGITYDFGHLQVWLQLCRRHEGDLQRIQRAEMDRVS